MKQIKMAIVGTGVWGETHISIYKEHPMAQVVAVCDIDIERAKAAAEKAGITQVYTDYNEMLRESQCDAVAIVTPDFAHGDIAVACAEAKKHMLIEKPIATSASDIKRIVEAVEKNGIRCMVDHHCRWAPNYNKTKQLIDSGEIGKPYTAYIRHSDIKWVATDMISWSAQSSIMWFLGSHSVDTLRWLFDSEVQKVYAVKRKGILNELGVDTDDIYLTTLEFENGGIAHMENGWCSPNGGPSVNDMWASVLCTNGLVRMDFTNHSLMTLSTDERHSTPDIFVGNRVFEKCNGLSYESIRDFVDRLVDGKEFRVTLKDAANTAYTVLAILESADSGQPVMVRL